jgi:hypothetical protein
MVGRLFFFALLVLFCLLFVGQPRAHEWFSGYKDPRPGGVGCCGGDDCFPVEPADIEYRPDGIYIRPLDELVPWDEVQKSEDHQYWRCKKTVDESRRCFFAPVSS